MPITFGTNPSRIGISFSSTSSLPSSRLAVTHWVSILSLSASISSLSKHIPTLPVHRLSAAATSLPMNPFPCRGYRMTYGWHRPSRLSPSLRRLTSCPPKDSRCAADGSRRCRNISVRRPGNSRRRRPGGQPGGKHLPKRSGPYRFYRQYGQSQNGQPCRFLFHYA